MIAFLSFQLSLIFVPQYLCLYFSWILQSAESESSFRHNENHFNRIPQGNVSGSPDNVAVLADVNDQV